MYQSMGLPWPEVGKETVEKNGPILIYGGSTATRAYAIQFAKLSGFDVTTTCSPRNFPMVKALGASAVFDYASPTCGVDIRAHTHNELYYAFDTVSEAALPQICADARPRTPRPRARGPSTASSCPRCHLAMMLREATPSATRLSASISPSGARFGKPGRRIWSLRPGFSS